jgi:hypothetical protein
MLVGVAFEKDAQNHEPGRRQQNPRTELREPRPDDPHLLVVSREQLEPGCEKMLEDVEQPIIPDAVQIAAISK